MFSFIQKTRNNLLAQKKVGEAISLVAEALEKAGYPERVQNAYELVQANESSLAFEILCENLYEFSCPISQKAYDLFEEAGKTMNVDSKYWEHLKNQIV